MKDKLAAVAFNLRNLLWRTEELKKEVETEMNNGTRKNIYEIRTAVNNLMVVLNLADENLKEIEKLIDSKSKVKRQINEDR